jgi:hypothetical protein
MALMNHSEAQEGESSQEKWFSTERLFIIETI